jgi:hypothetical protein
MDMAFADIRPTDESVILVPPDAWFLFVRLDAQTFHITESTRPPFIKPIRANPGQIADARNKPCRLFYLALPYLDTARELAPLLPFYDSREHVYAKDGYELPVYDLTLKAGTANAVTASPRADAALAP